MKKILVVLAALAVFVSMEAQPPMGEVPTVDVRQ